ncbi:MAG: hypothetical protein JXA10_03015 [Anaerolineae bacterium]|nr:hypothetical protein [Anaerolineae bacterium]
MTKKAAHGPHVNRSITPRKPAIESVYQGKLMRSLFEVEFAKALDARGIAWEYEPERIGGGRYLIDFYLPELTCWVEVKGRFEARDDLLLPLAATRLQKERGERLFLYMKTRAYRVTTKDFAALSHDEFWDAIQKVPEKSDNLVYLKRENHEKRGRRRPWEPDA